MKTIEGKVVALGSQGVGKTSMIVHYVGGVFNHNVNPTIGASFFTCKLNLENTRIKLQVWDTAGQERFRSMAPMYYRNANAAMLVFDLTQYNTFAAIKGWVTELRRNVEAAMVLAVIGNKSDLAEEREVEAEEGREYARRIGASYHETSVLQDEGSIEDVFLAISGGLLRLSSAAAGQESSAAASLKVYESTTSSGLSTPEATESGAVGSAREERVKPYGCC
ncbi:hypothetical protein KM043_000241 [Ampulex compressa]|nr:hypothetical protein KM043_000241 [Ampulex compressa]